ncbi:AAA family ATPase [Calditrichota bacterium LG25]
MHFLKQFYSNALRIDLLKPDVFRNYSARPERIIDLIHGNPQFKTIIVDEAQKVPEFLSASHHLMKENKNLQFVLTGSSARKIKRKDVNSLGGRAL